jgi:hypothetical protein
MLFDFDNSAMANFIQDENFWYWLQPLEDGNKHVEAESGVARRCWPDSEVARMPIFLHWADRTCFLYLIYY